MFTVKNGGGTHFFDFQKQIVIFTRAFLITIGIFTLNILIVEHISLSNSNATKPNHMKKIFTLVLCLLGAMQLQAQTICNPNGNLVLFTNYDGGTLNIDVDVNIPNLKIGIVSYEAVTINLSGAFVNNVTEVRFAGYNSQNSNNCGAQTIATTTINGAPATATTSVVFSPSSPLANANGNPNIICGYSCVTNTSQGGCNTIDQIEAYFAALMPGSLLRSHKVQYNCWSGSQTVSGGGTCCANPSLPLSLAVNVIQPSCNGQCNGSATATAGGGQSPYSFQWVAGPATAQYSNLCPGTYTVIVTDGASNTMSQTAVITNPAPITHSFSHNACSAFYFNGANRTASGLYKDTLLSAMGCDSVVTLNLTINTVNVGVTQAGATLTAAATGATYKWLNCATNALVPGATAQTYTATQSGNYAVIVTQNSCTDTSVCRTVTVSGIGEEESQVLISMFPNPFDKYITIKIPIQLYNRICIIYDATGRKIKTEMLTNTFNNIDMSQVAKGIYTVEISGLKTKYKISK